MESYPYSPAIADRRTSVMSTKGSKMQPAKLSERIIAGSGGEYEARDFALRRDKRRRLRDIAKASRRKNRV